MGSPVQMKVKVFKDKYISRWFEITSSMLDELASKTVHKEGHGDRQRKEK